jgi:hypothetical protein
MAVGQYQVFYPLVGKGVLLLMEVRVGAEVHTDFLSDHIGGAATNIFAAVVSRLLAGRTGAEESGPAFRRPSSAEEYLQGRSCLLQVDKGSFSFGKEGSSCIMSGVRPRNFGEKEIAASPPNLG